MRRTGFTIAEFAISITLMLVVAVAALPILFKKNQEFSEVTKTGGNIFCTCKDGEHVIGAPNTGYCEINLNNPSKEFYTIQILGGGGGGGTNSVGNAGEYKVVRYPSLNGKFRIQLGSGGQANQRGGDTVIYKAVKDTSNNEHWQLFEFAKGGITGNELGMDGSIQMPSFNNSVDTTQTTCGKGGNINGNGEMGEVIIRW